MQCNWTRPLAYLSLSSVMSWIRSDPSIWKPVFINLVLPNKVADSRERVKSLLDLIPGGEMDRKILKRSKIYGMNVCILCHRNQTNHKINNP